jgi:N6-adenosine-specific RNA methylase IME4
MIELFARGNKDKDLFGENRFDGWHTWGNEVECDIDLLEKGIK